MEIQINALQKPETQTQISAQVITDSKFIKLYSHVPGFKEIKDLVLKSFRKRIKPSNKDNVLEVQLGYLIIKEDDYNEAKDNIEALSIFWKAALNVKKLRVELSLRDCCWPTYGAVCAGCSIGKRNGQESNSD
jgi:hypothetical protein